MIMIGFRGQGRETLEKTEMSSKTNGPIEAPAERMRSYRQRQRRQWRSVRIEIATTEIDALVQRGYLDPKNRDDLAAMGGGAGLRSP